MTERMRHNRSIWQKWMNGTKVVLPSKYKLSIMHSMLIIKAHCDYRGSVLASGDSSIFNYGRDYYCYCWPRDSVYALWPLIRLGHYHEAVQFLDFVRDTIHPNGYLLHKYQPDRAIGSTWHPLIHNRRKELAIQEDETASVIFMINELYSANNDIKLIQSLYSRVIQPAANFMQTFIDDETGLPHASL
jgi:GH15 family glucan-1,4-alpha-glucosidase